MPKATPAKPPVTAAPTPRIQPPGKRRRMQAADFFYDTPTQPTEKEPKKEPKKKDDAQEMEIDGMDDEEVVVFKRRTLP